MIGLSIWKLSKGPSPAKHPRLHSNSKESVVIPFNNGVGKFLEYDSYSMSHTVRLNNYSGQIELRPNGKTVKQAVTQTDPSNESFNEKSVRVRLARIRELQGQVESMTVKNVQLYNWNKEKDKEILDLKNHNFKEWFKTTQL